MYDPRGLMENFVKCRKLLLGRGGRGGVGHLAPGRADYVKAFNRLNVNTEKISGTLFEISGALAKALATP